MKKRVSFWGIILIMLCSGCATSQVETMGKFKIIKVNAYDKKVSLRLEEQTFSQGQGIDKFLVDTATLEEDAVGEKFVVTWRYLGKAIDDIVVRVQYKTAKDNVIRQTEKHYASVAKGKYTYLFENIGKEFTLYGPIAVWKVDVLHKGVVVATKESVLWEDIERRKTTLS